MKVNRSLMAHERAERRKVSDLTVRELREMMAKMVEDVVDPYRQRAANLQLSEDNRKMREYYQREMRGEI